MKHGERYGYPTVLLKDIMSSASADTEFKITYDIACVFSKYVKKRNLLDSERCSWAVPVFHGYGHIASCQVSFSPRRIPGFGLLDGEAIERLWSYLRRFAKITKEMTPGHRLNLLSQGLDHFSKKKEDRLDKWLVERVIASEGQLDLCSADNASLQQKYKVPLTDLTLNEMISEEQEQFKKTPTSASGRGWRSQYIKDLLKWYSLRYSLDVL
ncbi:hypothetical protein CAPTEDRAFT_203517 [Capitella teleta]|uniref:Uncharacterized protein n=1 Tax=Capitella teleta TaxID=283909 RepID=R7U317_CAPTE|nr:hypothetical protein CAPTEDRAFT_203517 [Capitella teleta]|eukprot:ELT98066.1 hypothetical protein CAPTEDRAFT_203517 [Capitella teleta]